MEIQDQTLSDIELYLENQTSRIDDIEDIVVTQTEKKAEDDKTLDSKVSDISSLVEDNAVQTKEVLSTISNLNSVVKKEDEQPVLETKEIDPVVAKLIDDNKIQSEKIVEKLNAISINQQPIPVQDNTTDLNKNLIDISEKLNDIESTATQNTNILNTQFSIINTRNENSDILQNNTNNQNSDILQNEINDIKNVSKNIEQIATDNREYLEKNTLNNSEALQNFSNTFEKNENSNLENNLKLQQTLQTVNDATNNQINAENESKVFQNSLDNIINTSNNKFEKSLEDISINNESTNKAFVTSLTNPNVLNNKTTIENRFENLEGQVTNKTLQQTFNDAQIVPEKSNAISEAEEKFNEIKKNNEQLLENTTKIIEKNNSSDLITSPISPVLQPSKDSPNEFKELVDLMKYSVQLQSAMVQSIQQLISSQSSKRWSETPIKN